MQCRIAPSLGSFEDHPNNIWGTTDYTNKDEPVVMFGCYDLRDYIALWLHRSKSYIFWGGCDLRNLDKGFVLNDGKLRWISKMPFFKFFLKRLLKKAEHWVENEWEKSILNKYGIECQVCPSFLGKIEDYKVEYKYKKNPEYYLSTGQNREIEYGFGIIEDKASEFPNTTFHLYGSNTWQTKHKNVIIHGRVSKEKMNEEIKGMTGAIRLNKEDGFSEVLAKSILWGQYPISIMRFPYMNINYKKTPNLKGREYYLKTLNKFPWNEKLLNK